MVVQKTFPAFRLAFVIYPTDNVERIDYQILLFYCDVWEGFNT